MTRDEFISKAIKVHGDKYNYDKVVYKNNRTDVVIVCPIHGEFTQRPSNHLIGRGCPECGKIKCAQERAMSTDEFVEKAKKVHGNKYDYSKTVYGKNQDEKVCIICPEHGEFWQLPYSHLVGCGCPECGKESTVKKQTLTTQVFIERARKVHGDKYDYSKVVYGKSQSDKVCIICPKHGEFKQRADGHLNGRGCPECAREKRKVARILPLETLLEQFKKVHGDRYDYSKVKYVNDNTPIEIICPKHGLFWQNPGKHKQGCGCPKCNSSHLEEEIRLLLENNSLKFEEQKRFDNLKQMPFDFYLPDYKTAIECQGRQHFMPISKFGGKKGFEYSLKRDSKKKKFCIDNNIKLLYYADKNYNDEIITDKNKLVKMIVENDS